MIQLGEITAIVMLITLGAIYIGYLINQDIEESHKDKLNARAKR